MAQCNLGEAISWTIVLTSLASLLAGLYIGFVVQKKC